MYTVNPLHTDREFMKALGMTIVFTLFTIALGAFASHTTDSAIFPLLVGLGMAPVIRMYAAEMASEYRGYRTRVAMAAEARVRRDARIAAGFTY